jgi:hypothetical protein
MDEHIADHSGPSIEPLAARIAVDGVTAIGVLSANGENR